MRNKFLSWWIYSHENRPKAFSFKYTITHFRPIKRYAGESIPVLRNKVLLIVCTTPWPYFPYFPPTKMTTLLNLVFLISMQFITILLFVCRSLSNICWIALNILNLYVNGFFLCIFFCILCFISTAVENFLEWLYNKLFIHFLVYREFGLLPDIYYSIQCSYEHSFSWCLVQTSNISLKKILPRSRITGS